LQTPYVAPFRSQDGRYLRLASLGSQFDIFTPVIEVEDEPWFEALRKGMEILRDECSTVALVAPVGAGPENDTLYVQVDTDTLTAMLMRRAREVFGTSLAVSILISTMVGVALRRRQVL
jgi:hypothetical protein